MLLINWSFLFLLLSFVGTIQLRQRCLQGNEASTFKETNISNSLHIFHQSRKSALHLSSDALLPGCKTNSSLYLSLLLLANACDVEANPGPRTKYPCQICERAVTWKQRGVACDDCQCWYHVDCMHMSTPIYHALANSNISWHCVNCGLPQFSTSLFESFIIESSNSFSTLSSCTTPTSPGSPMATSSPSHKSSHPPKRNKNKRFKVLNVNFQSAKNKKEEIWNLIDSSKPDIILGTETWLKSDIASSEIFPPNYEVIRRDRQDGYGGVLIAISQDYSYEQISCDADCEAVFIKLALSKTRSLIVGSAYRPPSNSTEYMETLCNLLVNLEKSHKNSVIWLGGDFNLPDIDWKAITVKGHQYPETINRQFLDMLNRCGLQQEVTFPTRNSNILDLFLTNRPSLVSRCTCLPGIGDHDIVYIESDVTPRRNKPVRRKIFLWKRVKNMDMREECAVFQEQFLDQYSPESKVQDMWRDIKDFLLQLMDKHVPSKMSTTRFNQPWITTAIKRMSRRKKRSFLKARDSGTAEDFSRYRRLKKECTSACKEAYNKYLTDIISPDATANPKRFWSFINSKRCDSVGVAPLKCPDGLTYSDSQKKAEALNEQFVSVFNKNEDLSTIKDKGQSPYTSMDSILVTSAGILKLLSNLDVHKSTGPDGIPSRLLKELASELAPILTVFFQASLNQGEIPADWKKANVVPIFKKGERCQAANYRPISLTSIMCKMLEHIICSSIMSHFDDLHILSDAQHGFRKKRSCESQLILALQDLAKGIDAREQHDVILLDFSKAFDKVPHKRLLHKLEYYGVRNTVNKWISDFLSHRTQQVVLEGVTSSTADVSSGVPQGSVLGPLLFLAYVNDLPDYLSSDVTVRLFADDCMVYRKVSSNADSLLLQRELDSLQRWECDWLMQFNPPKCQVLTVTNKKKPVTQPYYIHGQELMRGNCAKYLGVHLTKNLSWNNHIDSMTKKANSTSAFLRRNIRSCPSKTKVLCYTALLRPLMEYACTVWDPHTQSNISKLEKVQRYYARFIFNDYQWRSSVTSMLNQLRWPSLQERRAQFKVIMMYRIANHHVDIPDSYLVPATTTSRGHSMRMLVPNARTVTYQKSFFPDSVRLWNSLPQEAVSCTTLDTFRKSVQCIQLR